jgi:hypothetical protein
MINIKKIRYPEMESIIRQHPNPEKLLGFEIFWQEKRDGSNLGIYLGRTNKIKIRSRNMDDASKDFYNIFNRTKEAPQVKELLLSLKKEWKDESIIFGELLTKGKSPTRRELHETDEFIVFDIWSKKQEGFIPYMLVYQYCHHFDLPIVELYGSSKHIKLNSLLKFRDKMLKIADSKKREGVIGKCFEGNKHKYYFKEKLDTPKLEKFPREIEEGKIELPQLPESEITGALEKVLVDIGFAKFKDKSIAMPLFAKYVAIECQKHNCVNWLKLYGFYENRCKVIKNG